MSLPALSPAIEAALWRADQFAPPTARTCTSGFAALDKELPGGGWPTHALTEVLQQAPRPDLPLAEWRLLLPCLRQIPASGPIVLIGPPQPPHAPALQQGGVGASQVVWVQAGSAPERLWATEQMIKGPGAAGELGALLAWLPQAQAPQVRRLQTWALQCDAPVFLLRPAQARQTSSAAPLRVLLGLGDSPGELSLQILKRRGPVHERGIALCSWPTGLEVLDGLHGLRRPAPPCVSSGRPTPVQPAPSFSKPPHALVLADSLRQ